MKQGRGFTLIEILIVMVIISIVSGVAMLAMTSNQNKSLEYFAQQLTQLIRLCEEQAMLQPTTLSLVFTSSTFQVYQYQKTWRPLPDKVFGQHPFPSNITLSLRMQNKPVPLDGKPHIIISSNGDVSPFIIFVGKKNSTPRYKIIGHANGSIRMHEANEYAE